MVVRVRTPPAQYLDQASITMPHTTFSKKLMFPIDEEGEEEMKKQLQVEANACNLLVEEKTLDFMCDQEVFVLPESQRPNGMFTRLELEVWI